MTSREHVDGSFQRTDININWTKAGMFWMIKYMEKEGPAPWKRQLSPGLLTSVVESHLPTVRVWLSNPRPSTTITSYSASSAHDEVQV